MEVVIANGHGSKPTGTYVEWSGRWHKVFISIFPQDCWLILPCSMVWTSPCFVGSYKSLSSFSIVSGMFVRLRICRQVEEDQRFFASSEAVTADSVNLHGNFHDLKNAVSLTFSALESGDLLSHHYS